MNTVVNYFQLVSAALAQMPQEPIDEIITILRQARADRRHIFIFGNGGSSATASHFVNDMIKSTVHPERPRFKVICLSDNTPTLTAYANDVSYDAIFAGPLAALAEPGDVALAISGSGNSANVLAGLDVAHEMGLTRLGLAGCGGGKMRAKCDVCVVVPSDSMQVIEDAHLVILHAIFLALRE